VVGVKGKKPKKHRTRRRRGVGERSSEGKETGIQHSEKREIDKPLKTNAERKKNEGRQGHH